MSETTLRIEQDKLFKPREGLWSFISDLLIYFMNFFRSRLKFTVQSRDRQFNAAFLCNWVDSAHDRNYWRALVNAALNLRVP